MDVVIDPPFTKEVLEYPNTGKLKPPAIDLYEDTRNPINYV